MEVSLWDTSRNEQLDGYSLLGLANQGPPAPGAALFNAGDTLAGVVVYHPIPLPSQVSAGILEQGPVWPNFDLNGDGTVDISDVIRAQD